LQKGEGKRKGEEREKKGRRKGEEREKKGKKRKRIN
jgi:hypothetical protein